MNNNKLLPKKRKLIVHTDERGNFTEILRPKHLQKKTFGQLSITTALPNQKKGGHYHKHMNEFFIPVIGNVLFTLTNIKTQKTIEIHLSSNNPEILHIPPYWHHTITNIGKIHAILLLYYDRQLNQMHPDAYS